MEKMISEEALKQFKTLWKEDYGEELSDELALEKALLFLGLINLVYRPVKKEWLPEKANGP